jgi:hypothetical protein
MRIISGRDYYDTAGWRDDSLLFLRKPEILTHSPYKKGHYMGRFHVERLWAGRRPGPYDTSVHKTGILFCGEIYPICIIMGYDRAYETDLMDFKTIPKKKIFYTAQETLGYLEGAKAKRNKIYTLGTFRSAEEVLEEHFSYQTRDEDRDFALDQKIVCGLIGTRKRGRDIVAPSRVLANGDFLADLEFYKMKPPQEAHQEISQFLGGVLTHQEKMVSLSNDDKIRKAGFDRRSFRKEKVGK